MILNPYKSLLTNILFSNIHIKTQGSDVVIFGGTISEGSEAVVLPENMDKYKNAEDFRGINIGCYRMETGHMVMKGGSTLPINVSLSPYISFISSNDEHSVG